MRATRYCLFQALLLCVDNNTNIIIIHEAFFGQLLAGDSDIKPVLGFMFTVAVQFLDH